MRVMSLQLSPFDPASCESDARQMLRILNADDIPGLAVGDYNTAGLTDPDPYQHRPWHPDHAYHLDADGRVDRRPAIRLERHGRMRHCADLAGAAWEPTTGHAPTDHHGPRRVDRWMATHHFPADAITGYRALPLDSIRHHDSWLTDHRPVEITLDWTPQ